MALKIGLVGFFGWGNFGDELFMAAHRQHLGPLGETVRLHDLTEPPYFSRPVDEAVDGVDCIVIGGGDLLIPWQLSELYWRPEFLRKPVYVVGVGVPAHRWNKHSVLEHYRAFLSHPNVRLILARDRESADWINTHAAPPKPAEAFTDLVCALKLPRPTESRTRTLGVVLRHRRDETEFSRVRRLCERAVSLGFTIRHLVLGVGATGRADLAVAEAFAEPGEEIVHSELLDVLCRAVAACEMLATMKFHGAVVAAMYGVPAITMSPTDKNINFTRVLHRPDLAGDYLSDDLPDRLPRFPAPIPPQTRQFLKRQAAAGYARLIAEMSRS